MYKKGFLIAMAHMMASLDNPFQDSYRDKETEIQSTSRMSRDEKMKRKGLTKFDMCNGLYIWALNEKTAIKKFNKRKN